MSLEPIPVLLNPAAGRGRAGQHAQKIIDIFGGHDIPCEVIRSAAVGDIEQRVFAIAKSGANSVIVAGGDGSIHEATNGILRADSKVALGVIPVGTGNDFAKASDTPLDWQLATTALAKRISKGDPPRQIDAGRMNDRFFANGVGIGFDAKINLIARKYQWPIGDLVYLFAVIEGLWDGVITPKVKMTYDEVHYEGQITLANISNGPWVGGMFHIAPMAKIDDGKLDLIVAAPVTRRRILALLPKLIKGKHIGATDISAQRIQHFKLVAEAPVPSHLDGESQPLQSEFDIEILPRALSLL